MSSAPATAPALRFNENDVRLRVLIDALDALGLTGVMPEARGLLARAADVETAQRADHARARRERDELVGQVAAGELPLDEATRAVAVLAAWLSPRSDSDLTPARAFAEKVAARLRGQARDAARRDGLDVHAALARLAAGAVRRGVDAGRYLVDVPTVVGALQPPKRAERQVVVGGHTHELHDEAVLPAAPPPSVTVETFERDPQKMGHWAAATSAAEELAAVHAAAELLHGVVGGQSTPFGAETDTFAMSRVHRFLPVQVHLVVFAGLGWKPGLHIDLRPRRPRPPDASRFEIVGGVRVPAGWTPGAAVVAALG
jgi:hypothetical protein